LVISFQLINDIQQRAGATNIAGENYIHEIRVMAFISKLPY
jgi:hypothetical protein